MSLLNNIKEKLTLGKSIKSKLYLSLLVINVLALMIGLTAWIVFRSSDNAMHIISEDMVSVQEGLSEIVSLNAQLSAYARNLPNAQNTESLEKTYNNLLSVLSQIESVLNNFAKWKAEQLSHESHNYDYIRIDEIKDLNEELQHALKTFKDDVAIRIAADEQQDKHEKTLGDAHAGFIVGMAPISDDAQFALLIGLGNQAVQQEQSLQKQAEMLTLALAIQAEGNLLAGIFETALHHEELEGVAPIKERYEATFDRLVSSLKKIDQSRGDFSLVNASVETFHALGTQKDNIFDIQIQRLEQLKKLRTDLEKIEDRGAQINAEINGLTAGIKTQILQTKIQTKTMLQNGGYTIIAVTALSFIFTLFLIWFYIRRRVIDRIDYLKTIMLALADKQYDQDIKGRNDPDEIGRMANALALFQDRLVENEQLNNNISEQKSRTDAIIENLNDGLITIDARGMIQSYNKGAEKIFGYRVKEVLGKNVSILMPSPHKERHNSYLARYYKTGVAHIMTGKREVYARHKDGRQFPVWLGVTEAFFGGEQGFIGIVQDISERKAKEEEILASKEEAERLNRQMSEYTDKLELARLKETKAHKNETRQRVLLNRLLDNMPLIVFAKYVQDDYTYAIINKAAESFFGHSAEEMIGKTDYDFFPKEQSDFFRSKDIETIEKGNVVFIEQEPITTPTETFIARTIKVPIYDEDGKPLLLLGITEDVTERIKAQDELKKAKEDAEEASRSKSDFLANMSHEIRTPMNAVLGMSSLLLDTNLDQEQKEWAVSINRSGENLLHIINDIIDISKIESGKLVLEKTDFDFPEILQEISGLYAHQAREKQIEMVLNYDDDLPLFFKGDPVRLKQIFANMISNALKFTSQGHIMIELHKRPDSKGKKTVNIECRIQDTGIGIAKDKQKKIFEKFAQAEESTTRKFGGTGLGLNIVMQLVEMMGGKVTVESEEGKGSTFIFNIKLEKSDKSENWDIDENISNLRALVIDDYELTRKVLQTTLMRAGMTCDIATTSEQALEILQADNAKYDVCIIDYLLEGSMDGLKLVEMLRADKKFDDVVLIMVSGMMDSVPYADLKTIGLEGYLKKPFRNNQILGAIKLAVRNKRTGKDAPIITRHNITNVISSDPGYEPGSKYKQYPDCKVLAVEDIKMNMILIKKVLSKFGVQIDTATDGIKAFEKTKENDYDIIFMDCQMPEMDGFESTRHIRKFEQDSNKPNVPIVALTADAMVGDKEKCLAAGMDDYINKPFKEIEIANALGKWIADNGKE